MQNKEMEAMLRDGTARDVSMFEQTAEGYFKLPDESYADFELCVADTEHWIKSVGKHFKTGKYVASLYEVSFQSPRSGWDCVWIR